MRVVYYKVSRAVLVLFLLQFLLLPVCSAFAEQTGPETKDLAAKGIVELQAGDFVKANDYFNKALKFDPASSQLNFLNALTYHARTGSEGVQNYDLADEGYQIAIRHDNSNWLYYYFYGLSKLDRKQYRESSRLLAEAVLLNDREPDLLYAFLYSAYHASDIPNAHAALYRLSALEPESRRVKRAKIILAAAAGNNVCASKELASYQKLFPDDNTFTHLQIRAGDWANMFEYVRNNRGELLMNEAEADLQDAEHPMPDMVVFDAAILRNEDEITHSMGVNLLNGLSLQFGNATTPAVSFNRSYKSNRMINPDGTDDTVSKTITNTVTGLISVPALTYSMNIFNMGSSQIDVIARPTLTGMLNMDSEFFSGDQISAAAAGSPYQSALSVSKNVGVTLHVKPYEITRNRVKLHIELTRTFLEPTDKEKLTYQYSLTTSSTKVSTDVNIAFGETMILSGLYERETVNTRDGVPLLQEIPLVQYLFSKKTKRIFQRSVIILLTPYINPNSHHFNTRAAVGKNPDTKGPLKKLKKMHPDWYIDVDLNTDRILEHLQDNHFVKEFRSGDLIRYQMVDPSNIQYRLSTGLDYLHY